MPKLRPGQKMLQVILPEAAYEELKRLASKMSEPGSRVSAGELGRRAIDEYLKQHGVEVDTTIGTWGGDRRSEESTEKIANPD